MAFDNTVRMPNKIMYGSQSGPGYRTTIVNAGVTGAEERIGHYPVDRRRLFLNVNQLKFDEATTILDIFHVVRGALISFRARDPWDYATTPNHRTPDVGGSGSVEVSATDVVLGVGDGANQDFQLTQRYASGSATQFKPITKPIASTVQLALDGTPIAGTAFTVDDTTGLATITPAPALGVQVTGGCEYDVAVRFSESLDREFLLDIANFDTGGHGSIELIEDIGETTIPNIIYAGRGTSLTLTADTRLTLAMGNFVGFKGSGVSPRIILPNETRIPDGRAVFHLARIGAAAGQELSGIYRSDGVTQVSTLGTFKIMSLYTDDVTGAKTWAASGF